MRDLLAGPADEPIVMLNFLRFKPAADAPDAGVSGEEAYRRYAEPMIAYVRSKGGRVIWTGRVDVQMIGTGADAFHMVALVEYPSRAAFLAIATDPPRAGHRRAPRGRARGPVARRGDADRVVGAPQPARDR